MRRRPSAMLLALALSSCGGTSPRAATPAALPRPSVSTRLFVRDNGGAPAALLVHGTLAGHPTSFVVDSGSSGHLLATWAVRRFGLATVDSDHVHIGVDGVTNAAPMVEHPAVTLDGWGAVDAATIDVGDLGDELEAANIAGLVSPQRLATASEDVVLDVPGGRMSRFASRDVPALLRAQAQPLFGAESEVCALTDGGWVYVATAAIEGVRERLIVDTGSTNSVTSLPSAAGQRLSPRAAAGTPAETLNGEATSSIVNGVEIVVGSVRADVDMELQPALPAVACHVDGMIGLDVTGDCVIAFGRTSLRGACTVEQ